ncbi:unnamed protein product [Urochloa humidicola]
MLTSSPPSSTATAHAPRLERRLVAGCTERCGETAASWICYAWGSKAFGAQGSCQNCSTSFGSICAARESFASSAAELATGAGSTASSAGEETESAASSVGEEPDPPESKPNPPRALLERSQIRQSGSRIYRELRWRGARSTDGRGVLRLPITAASLLLH